METYETIATSITDAGQKLLVYSKATDFTANRGLVVELFPFIYGASARMSAKAISEFLESSQQIKLSSVTINKALKNPAKSWSSFFDLIEPSARIFAKDYGEPMKNILFEKEFFYTIKNPIILAAAKMLVKEEVVKASSVLRSKWFTIDWETRLKARPYLEHKLMEKGK